mgnify:FL=1
MISFHQFVEYMRKEQEKRFEGRLAIEVEHVKKNNGVLVTSLVGKKSEDKEGIMVYLDSYYDAFKEGVELEQLSEDIYDMFNTYEKPDFPLDELGDFEQVKDKIFYKLVNYDKNLEMLKEVPHVPYLDLALTFHVLVERNEKGQSICPVRQKDRIKWGQDIGALYELAKENTPKLFPVSLCSMGWFMENILKDSQKECERPELDKFLSYKMDSPLYILSNQSGIYGAAAVLYEDVLKNFAFMEECDVVLLPSSIHEFLLLPYKNITGPFDIDKTREMVEHINRVDVPKTDILSDNVYLYDREKDKISIL